MISGEFLAALVDSLAPGGNVAADVTLPAASLWDATVRSPRR